MTQDLYLVHYGTKGMKWGVRRSSKKKESLSERRERRKTLKRERKHARSMSKRDSLLVSTDAKYLYKHRSALTDDELRNRINRINMETQLKDLSRRNRNFGEKTATNLLKRIGNAYFNAAVNYSVNESMDYVKGKRGKR